MLLVEDSPSFKDPAERRVESDAQSLASWFGCLVLAMAHVSHTLTEWAKLLRQGLGNEQVFLVYM